SRPDAFAGKQLQRSGWDRFARGLGGVREELAREPPSKRGAQATREREAARGRGSRTRDLEGVHRGVSGVSGETRRLSSGRESQRSPGGAARIRNRPTEGHATVLGGVSRPVAVGPQRAGGCQTQGRVSAQ